MSKNCTVENFVSFASDFSIGEIECQSEYSKRRQSDAQYDKIDEVKEVIAELKSQVFELKKNQIYADSIYRFP